MAKIKYRTCRVSDTISVEKDDYWVVLNGAGKISEEWRVGSVWTRREDNQKFFEAMVTEHREV